MILALSLTACKEQSIPSSDDDDSGGIGFTYTGKPGFEIGEGLYMPFDGSGPGLGYP